MLLLPSKTNPYKRQIEKIQNSIAKQNFFFITGIDAVHICCLVSFSALNWLKNSCGSTFFLNNSEVKRKRKNLFFSSALQ